MIFKLQGIEKVVDNAQGLPRHIKASQKSALGSVGYHLIQELKKQIETEGTYAGSKWKSLHPLTRLPKQRTGKRQRLTLRKNKPLKGLKRFTRYRVSNNAVQVLFARSAKGKVGQFDRLMNQFVRRSEYGESQSLTKKSKKFRAARGFPVRKSTAKIRIPYRKTINPVYRKNETKLPKIFEKKFEESLRRKQNV